MKEPLLRRPALPSTLESSAAVRKYVREHGGRLFVWFQPVGRGWLLEKVSVSAPPGGRSFDEYDTGDYLLFLERDIPLPGWIRLERRRWPFAPVTVVTGAEVGATVDVFQNPPGTYG